MSHHLHSGPKPVSPSSSSLDPFETSPIRSPPTVDVELQRIELENLCGCIHPLRWVTTEQRRLFGFDMAQWLRVIAAFTLHPPTDDVMHDGPHPKWCKRLQRVCDCCRYAKLVATRTGGVAVRSKPCRDRCCPRCATARGKRVADRIAQMVQRMNAPRFLTLTIQTDGLSLEDAISKLMESFRRLRRRPEWREKVIGGVYVVEVTRGQSGDRWHPHLHCIVDGYFWLQQTISKLWLAITGDSSIVHIEAIVDRGKTANYIGRYIGKPTGWEEWGYPELSEFARAMQGKRLVHTFGSLHNAKCDPPDELLEHRHDRKLCTVGELYTMVERGFPDALAAFELMGTLNGPLGALARRPGIPIYSRTYTQPDDATLAELRRLLTLAIEHREWHDNPAPPKPAPPPPLLPGLNGEPPPLDG